jgi:regulation of enolase protein 1 (concanavalin A-like superfamily)
MCGLAEHFDGARPDARLSWHCAPASWFLRASHLVIEPDAPTDFWQRTHYGFSADNGHLLYADTIGDFMLATRVRWSPVHQYDQAGLMLRQSPDCWIKTSVEFEPDHPSRLGAVITRNGYSDWSTQDFPGASNEIELRIERRGQDVRVDWRLPRRTTAPDMSTGPAGASPHLETSANARNASPWTQIRLGHLPFATGAPVQAGLYACSPKGAGFIAEFDFLRIEPA